MGEENSRNILLFADGTSNSSDSPQKTNVWRLYAALDLGTPQPGHCEQIAFYDNGVGNSKFTPAALLGIIFGIGVARNVRDIYKFLCRNYREGDRIFAFGFSRGAYTIRLLVAAVCSLGLAPYESEEDLDLAARDCWRQLRRSFHTNNILIDFFVCAMRALGGILIRAKRRVMRQSSNYRFAPGDAKWWFQEWLDHWRQHYGKQDGALPVEQVYVHQIEASRAVEIEFVGVWDTVAAYGGPIVEITRAIDEWVWPLSMPNYRLHPRVKVARHALAIDDKRDSFTPLLWDEVHDVEEGERLRAKLWKASAAARPTIRMLAVRYNSQLCPRIQQVWFAGMHADVGGGYPDDSLAYVSLSWMISHARRAGARLIGQVEKQIFDYRNIYGPIHNNRAGFGAFYRYQPRYINAWVDHRPAKPFETSFPASMVVSHVQPATQIFRDPTIAHKRYVGRGLLNFPIRLHESVEGRLADATDGYAPINLPGWYRVDRGPGLSAEPDFPKNEDKAVRQARLALAFEMGYRIKLRRFWYFVAFLLVTALATRPYWPKLPYLGKFAGTVDDRTDAQLVEAAVASFLPGFLGDWLHALFADLITSLMVLAMIVVATALGIGQERTMTDIARSLWDSRFQGNPPDRHRKKFWFEFPTQWLSSYFAKSDEAQSIISYVKWRIVPNLLGPVMIAAALYAILAGATQLGLIIGESRKSTCPIAGDARDSLLKGEKYQSGWIDIREKCADLAVLVATGRTYHMTVDMADASGRTGTESCHAHWIDGSFEATPQGWVKSSAIDTGSTYFRRVVSAPLMAPILEYRPDRDLLEDLGAFDTAWIHTVGVPSYLDWPQLKQGGEPYRWTGSFTTPGTESSAFNPRDIAKDWTATDTEQDSGKMEVARVHVFLNDATLLDRFYENNHGKMRICMWSDKVPGKDRVCGEPESRDDPLFRGGAARACGAASLGTQVPPKAHTRLR